ncbi:hypothetical protein GAO09_09150 [Rhizobiales bacterium RZME27]|uniref:Antitoxin VbhA domain-containing protein n=1 Tax=Endobacterium cereale TaxID=2663029 RepID=A0A6A8A6C1_9HYPH|nr:hypothetical protein [Endobacterium cereale]MQY46214.1 hypothetical protein [Endobacterium cereale]
MAIDSDRRRTIFDRVRTTALLRGMPIDSDPEFIALVDLWISGEYEMPELRSRYNDLTARRAQRSRSVTHALETTPNQAETFGGAGEDADPRQRIAPDAD